MFVSYYLLKDGHTVTLVDGDSVSERTSVYNGGLITPSSAPAPMISMRRTIYASLRQLGPIYISPGQFLGKINWFLPFLSKGIGRSGEVTFDLGKRSLKLYRDFFKEESVQADLKEGMIALYADAEHATEAAHALKGRFVDEAEASELGFKGFGGGVLFEDELSINPAKLHSELRRRLTEMGARVVLGSNARLQGDKPRVRMAKVDDEELIGDQYVIAAGARTSELCRPLGYDPQIIPARGLAMIFDTGGAQITRVPAIFEDHGIVAVQHNEDCFRLSSFFDIVGFRDNLRQSRRKWLLETASRHLSNYGALRYLGEGVGYRPCTPDHLPLIGRIPGYDNLHIASGHCRLGVTLAPGTGRIMSSLISGRELSDSIVLNFDPRRFAR
jgi:D-amino-acid dehydrogenase